MALGRMWCQSNELQEQAIENPYLSAILLINQFKYYKLPKPELAFCDILGTEMLPKTENAWGKGLTGSYSGQTLAG